MTHLHDTIHNPLYISLNSAEYSNSYNSVKSHLNFELYQPIIVSNNIDTYLSVESFKFCNSFYNITSYKNIFYFALGPSYSIDSFIIPAANYSITTLLTFLNTNTDGFTFAYDDSTLKITITNIVEFIIYNNIYNCNKILGLNDSLSSSNGYTLSCPNMINLIGTQILYITIPNLGINSFGIKTATRKSLILTVPITSMQGDTQTYSNSGYKHKVLDSIITNLEIQISDESGNTVNFNSIDWYLTLNFIFSYKKIHIKGNYLTNLKEVENEVEEVENAVED